MNYVKHNKSDLTYGVLNGIIFQQHKWESENKKPGDKPRGVVGSFRHLPSKEIENINDFISISADEYATLYYKDSKRII